LKSQDQYDKFLESFNSSNILEKLKASNVASNSTGLDFYSDQIEKKLDLINNSLENPNILDNCKKIISETKGSKSHERIDKYIEFGEIFKLILFDLLRVDESNIEHIKKIAVQYLDIARVTRDEKIKNIAFEIADELSK
jgi:hypothetical protein